MNQAEALDLEHIEQEVSEWLRRDAASKGSKLEMITALANALTVVKRGSSLQRDIVEKILEIMPDAGKINPVKTMDALSESFLWVGTEYIPSFAQRLLMLEKPAIAINPSMALASLEKILIICHCALIPLKIHGYGKDNDTCIEWQRQTFSSIITAVENHPSIDPAICANVLKISEMITYMNDKFSDLNQKIHYISHEHQLAASSWH